MAAYIIAEVDVTDTAGYEEYRKLVPPSLEQYGGRYVVRGGKAEALEGEWTPRRLVVIEFDSAEQATKAHGSEGYQAALKALNNGAERDMRIVEGVA